MASVNKVIIVGHLGKDPDTKYMGNGDAVTNIAVATSESWKDKNTGEKKEMTEWHRVTFYRQLAEIAGQYLKKGAQVYVEGRLQTRKWTDKEGVERFTTEIIADRMQMLGSPQGGSRGGNDGGDDDYGQPTQQQTRGNQQRGNQQQQRGGGNQQQRGGGNQRPAPNYGDLDDDIPF